MAIQTPNAPTLYSIPREPETKEKERKKGKRKEKREKKEKKEQKEKERKEKTYACPSSANMQSISLSRSNERS
jgi:hypothetical protein